MSLLLLFPVAAAGATTGTSAATKTALTSTATGAQAFTATAAATKTALTATATGAQAFAATSAASKSALTSAATGAQAFTGTGGATKAPITAGATAAQAFTGAAAAVKEALTASATGDNGEVVVPPETARRGGYVVFVQSRGTGTAHAVKAPLNSQAFGGVVERDQTPEGEAEILLLLAA